MTLTLLLLTGQIVYYGPGHDMAAIAQRQGVAIPAGYVGIAHYDRDRLGWLGTLTVGDTVLNVAVVDYTHPDDLDLVRHRDIVAEVDYPTACELGMVHVGRLPGTLILRPPEMAPGGRQWL